MILSCSTRRNYALGPQFALGPGFCNESQTEPILPLGKAGPLNESARGTDASLASGRSSPNCRFSADEEDAVPLLDEMAVGSTTWLLS